MHKKILHIFALCSAGLCCLGSEESVKNALTTKWVSYAGGSAWYDRDAVYALATDIHTNAYFAGVLGSGWLDNYDIDWVDTVGLLDESGVIGSGFVAKTDHDGVLVWTSTLTYEWGSTISGVTSANGAVYVGGAINRQIEVYEEQGYVTYTWVDALLGSLNAADGSLNWSRELNSIPGVHYFDTQSSYTSIAVDAAGNIYAVGYTTITNLPSSAPYAGGKDVVVAKYEADGDLLWVRYLGGSNDEQAYAVSIGPDGIYVSGTTQSSGSWITLGDNTLPSLSNGYGFLSKLALNGAVLYTTVLGGNANDEILSMQTVSNLIYLAGTTYSTNFCNAHKLNTAGGGKDGFVLKLTDYGTTYQTNWFRYVGTNTADGVYALSLMDSNRVVLCGSTDVGGWLPEFDEFSKTYSGGTDGFIYQLNQETGVPVWSTYVGAESNDTAYAMAICGISVFLGGTTASPGWEMFGGFRDRWGDSELVHLNTETGFMGMWSQDPGIPPVITNDIADVTVHEGQRVEFLVVASSKPAAKYHWLTNGVPVGGVSTNRYVIGSALPSDNASTYQCIASNVFGCTTSSVAHLSVIANGMLNVSITPPSAVAAGAKWRLDEGVWTNAGSFALYPGTYTVSFSNLVGWTTPATRQVVVESSQTTTTEGGYVAPSATAVRSIALWTNVSLAVTCPPEVTAWTLVETLPVNSTPVNYGAGVWNGTARTLAYTGTVSSSVNYTVLLGAVGDYEVAGSVTSMPINVTMPVTGDNRVSRGNFLRKISGTNVCIYMSQPTSISFWYLTENLSGTTLTPSNISLPGIWTPASKTISWSTASIGAGVILSYNVSGVEGSTNVLAGTCFVSPDGFYTTYGDNMVIIPMPPPVPPPSPTILNFTFNGASGFLSFTSVVDQAYMVLTNANIAVTNGWRNCVPATGQGSITTVAVPVIEPQLFYRVKSE